MYIPSLFVNLKCFSLSLQPLVFLEKWSTGQA